MSALWPENAARGPLVDAKETPIHEIAGASAFGTDLVELSVARVRGHESYDAQGK